MSVPHALRHTGALALLLTGVALLGPGVAAANPDPTGTIYVADYANNTIDVFAAGASGNVAPIRQITGSVSGPADVAVDANGDVYSSNFNNNTITVYAPGASGAATPIRTIGGTNTGLCENDDISVAPDGTLYVGSFCAPITVYAPGANGNVAPIRTITSETGVDGLGVDATGTLYADHPPGVDVFAPGANGAASPIRTISGSNTNLAAPDDVKVGFGGQLFVTDNGTTSIEVFAPGATGNATPTQSIAGSNTNLSIVDDLAVDATGGIYETNFNASGVNFFAPGATGNVAPTRNISGTNTTLSEPEGVAVAEPASGDSMSTNAASTNISLGSPTSDTATLSGANSPTGSIVFNLYGPNDATCTKAPAFTSSPVTVSGNASYSSPSFTPTAAGTYSWVAEYSGDTNNAPITTACGDPNETVTVNGSGDPLIHMTGYTISKSTLAVCVEPASFTDPDPAGTASEYSASIDWNDGSSSAGSIKAATHGPAHFEVNGCHTYTAPGTYQVTVTVTDPASGNVVSVVTHLTVT